MEFDNYGASRHPGEAGKEDSGSGATTKSPGLRIRARQYRSQWLRYAWDWVRKTDPNGYLEMPGSRTETSLLDHSRWYYANDQAPPCPMALTMKRRSATMEK